MDNNSQLITDTCETLTTPLETNGSLMMDTGETKEKALTNPLKSNQIPSTSNYREEGKESKEKDSQVDAEVQNRNIRTIVMEPYQARTNMNKRKKFKPEISAQIYNKFFGQNKWARFLTLKTSRPIPRFIIENALLSKYKSQDMSLRRIAKNEWMVEATTATQSEELLEMKHIGNIEIRMTKNSELNSIHGTAIMPDYDDDDDDYEGDIDDEYFKRVVLDSLKKRYENVEDIEIYKIPSKKTPNKKIKIIKIKFEGFTIPNRIKILGETRELREYVPKPLQCQKCSMFGHPTKACRNESICAFCGSKTHATKWFCGEAKCRNCDGPHHARTKTCPFYIYNAELKLLQARQGLNIRAAKAELKARNIMNPATKPTYGKKTRESNKTMQVKSVRLPISLRNSFSVLSDDDESDEENHSNAMDVSHADIVDERSKPKVERAKKSKQNKTSNQKQKIMKKRTSGNLSPSNEGQVSTNKKHCKDLEKKNNTNKEEFTSEDELSQTTEKLDLRNHSGAEDVVLPSINLASSQDEVTSSPVIGRQSTKTNVNPNTEMHQNRRNCGCDRCFSEEINKHQGTMSSTKMNNIIENFIKNKEHNIYGQLSDHHTDCMCVDHLIKKRKSESLNIKKYISNLQQKQGAKSKLSNNDQSNSSSMVRVDYKKINKNSSVNMNNLTALT